MKWQGFRMESKPETFSTDSDFAENIKIVIKFEITCATYIHCSNYQSDASNNHTEAMDNEK